MLSPNSIPSKRATRASSNWSLDSGYGSGIHEDARLGSNVSALDWDGRVVASTKQSQLVPRDIHAGHVLDSQLQAIGLGITGPSHLELDDQVVIKEEEEYNHGIETPQLRVCTAFSSPSSSGSPSPVSPLEVKRSRAGKSSKLPSQAIGQLNAWLDANRHHPYPNAETKQALAHACDITVKQVTTWFTNTRQRQLKSQENDTVQTGSGLDRTPSQASRKGKKKDYRRSNGASPIDGLLSPPRLSPCASVSENSSGEGDSWQCTFCRMSLTSKSWRRHEETLHHPKYQWTCLAFGPRIPLLSCSSTVCAFCELENPAEEHFEQFHRIGDCQCKDPKERTFGRPDHLQQHAKNFHKIKQPLSELVRDTWRKDGPGLLEDKDWTCGFCHEVLSTWDAREKHIAGHFKSGLTMAQWREDRSRSALPAEHNSFNESANLDALASMGTTIAGPSYQRLSELQHSDMEITQSFEPHSALTTGFMPVATGVPDLNFDQFGMYGNPINSFIPSTAGPTPYYPQISNMPSAPHNTEATPMDFDFTGYEDFGNLQYGHGDWNPSW